MRSSQVVKSPSAVRFGILGAARIAPNALITPAQSHTEVVIAAVACRDERRGMEYAKKHRITRTFSGVEAYHKLIADPDLDAVYIALPNGLHFEWALRALQAGKHVLIEKPTTNTAEEAREIFALAHEKGLVALEAMHSIFHPALQRARDIVASGDLGKVKGVIADFALPSVMSSLFFQRDDPRFQYDLGGGCMMDMGVYPLAAARFMTSSDTIPLTINTAEAIGHALDPSRVDRSMHATFTLSVPLPTSSTTDTDTDTRYEAAGELTVDFAMPGRGPFGVLPRMPKNEISIQLERGDVLVYNFVSPGAFHYIRVTPNKGRTRFEQAYTFKDGRGAKSWSSYRYQLEAFVDKVRDRKPPVWPEAVTVLTELESIERVYAKAGLPARSMSSYKPEEAVKAAGTAPARVP
ncbi:NAD(P)-binding protein [Daedaleopsis nitida]|nr:NAD(P)-binding protein [Daedaleopsis nitida]